MVVYLPWDCYIKRNFCPLSISLQLHVEDLQATITYMHDNKKYKRVRSNPICAYVSCSM